MPSHLVQPFGPIHEPEPPTAPEPTTKSFGRSLFDAAPTAGIIAVLIALAVWGHESNWTVPKFSELIGGKVTAKTDWCDEHNVPDSQCVECHPNLMAPQKDYGWCPVHGVMDCPLEHPEVAQLKTKPTITPAMFARAHRALALRPRVENNSRCSLHMKLIQFASVAAMDKVGVDIAIVTERPIVESIPANGELGYDQTRMAHFSSRVPGTVWRVQKQIGDRVAKGDVLALIDAADVGRLKSEFLQAIAQVRLKQDNVDRLRPLAGNVIPAREFLVAQTEADEANIRLHRAQQALVNLGLPVETGEFARVGTEEIARRMQFLGLPAELVSQLDARTTTSNLLPIRSSLDGVVVSRSVVEGEVVDTKSALFDVADTSRLWLTLNVRQEDAKYVSLGQKVLFSTNDSSTKPETKSLVSWISTDTDEATRTVKVRVDLANDDGRLR
ncbi:MAG TPA: efflux RND transporter periplasmic adaptor subunit, partial [Lacipirellulaceae bacterium]|nr:efflux RND transporter periplasmic adaptor subunit [Lacipirellulaceae bacterium]